MLCFKTSALGTELQSVPESEEMLFSCSFLPVISFTFGGCTVLRGEGVGLARFQARVFRALTGGVSCIL